MNGSGSSSGGQPNNPPDSDLNSAEKDANQNFWFNDVGKVVQGCDALTAPTVVSPDKTHWIEIALVDQDGNPVPDEQYSITLPHGSKQSGSLNAKGRARIEGIDAGNCKITFTKLHKTSWQ